MMLRWRSSAVAVALIAFIVLGTSGSGHAADYRLPSFGHNHDRGDVQVCPPSDRANSERCAVCHWLQTFRFAQGGAVLIGAAPQSSAGVATGVVASIRTASLTDIPARAPPA